MDRHVKALQLLKEGTVIPANPLAIDANRKYDPKHQRALTRYYLDAGVGGIAIAVHTTQFAIRDPKYNLFEPVLKTVAEEIERYENETGRVIVRVAGVCGETAQATKEAEIAKKYGYDAVLVSPGGLSKLSEEELLERTRAIAKVMPVIGFYLQPSVGGRVFTYSYWEKMCEIDQVVAVKAASFNRYQTIDLVRAATLSSRRNEIALYTGNDDNLVVDLLTKYKFTVDGKTYENQFVGGLLGHWSVWTKTAVEMFKKIKSEVKAGRISPDTLTLAAEVTDSNGAFFDVAHGFKGCIAGLHEVLRRQGLFDGIWCLDPNETMSPGQKEEIDRVYKMYPHLNDDKFVAQNLEKWLR